MVQMSLAASLEDLFHWRGVASGNFSPSRSHPPPAPVSSHFASLVTTSLAHWPGDTQSPDMAQGSLGGKISPGGEPLLWAFSSIPDSQ